MMLRLDEDDRKHAFCKYLKGFIELFRGSACGCSLAVAALLCVDPRKKAPHSLNCQTIDGTGPRKDRAGKHSLVAHSPSPPRTTRGVTADTCRRCLQQQWCNIARGGNSPLCLKHTGCANTATHCAAHTSTKDTGPDPRQCMRANLAIPVCRQHRHVLMHSNYLQVSCHCSTALPMGLSTSTTRFLPARLFQEKSQQPSTCACA